MATHISHAALPYPIKGARFTIQVPYLDADGDPTDPTTPDSEVSQDGGAFADAAEEVTTISGSNGMGYLTLSGAETNNSTVSLAFKVASGPKATLMALYPRVLASVGTGTLSAGSAGGGTLGTLLAYDVTGCFIKTTGGTGGGGTGGANNQVRRIITYNTSTGAFTVAPNWETTPDNTTTYDVLLPDGVTLGMLRALNPASAGRTVDVDSSGRVLLQPTQTGVTIPTVTTLTGHTPQTGDAYARIGANGSGLTALGDTRLAELEAGNLPTDIANVKSDTAAILLDTGTNGVVVASASKTGYTLSSAGILAIWDQLLSATFGVGSIGEKIKLFFAALGTDNRPKISADSHTGGATITAVGTLTTYTGNTPQTGDAYARLGAPANASIAADIAAVKTDTGNLVTRITSTLFSGITSLAQWLGAMAGKQTANSTARTEIRATGAGGGTFDETTDSQEGLRDTLPGAISSSSVTISYSQVALQLAAAVEAGTITLRRGDRISLQVTGLGAIPVGRDKLWFTVKRSATPADSASLIQITETGGLLYFKGAVPGDNSLTSADGSLTVDDATDGDVTVVLSAAAAALFSEPGKYVYDFQYQDGSTVTTLAQGVANVVLDVTRATS